MSFEKVSAFFESAGLGERVLSLTRSSATVAEAAEAVGCRPEQIAKTLSFFGAEGPVLIVAAGDARVDNKKFRQAFGVKARMIPAGEVEEAVGHAPGGVCPFVVREGVRVFLDRSLRRFEVIYPAAGNAHSAVRLTPDELAALTGADWTEVCSVPEP